MTLIRHSIIALIAAFSVSAQAQNLAFNGSLTGPTQNVDVPDGWMIVGDGTPDVMDAMNNAGKPGLQQFGAAPSASPDGGTWVGIGAYSGVRESFGQTLRGLKVGALYSVSWLVGNFGFSSTDVKYTDTNAIQVLSNGVVVGQGNSKVLGSDWRQESITFQATSAESLLSFRLADMNMAYMSIDGISVQQVGEVPEPTAGVLMGLGLLGVVLVARRRQA